MIHILTPKVIVIGIPTTKMDLCGQVRARVAWRAMIYIFKVRKGEKRNNEMRRSLFHSCSANTSWEMKLWRWRDSWEFVLLTSTRTIINHYVQLKSEEEATR
jgi:hypothetical protein